jgi:3-methyladenine DNA glycosylase AlkD
MTAAKTNPQFYQDCLKEVDTTVRRTPKTVVAQRQLSRYKYSFSQLPFERQILIWDFIWKHAENRGTKTQAYFYCERFAHKPSELLSAWKIIKTWQEQVSDWGYCDALAKLYTKILERKPKTVLSVLKQWNRSSDLFKRRQSIVSLLYFCRTKKQFLPFKTIIGFVDNLLQDKEYYVQKGVGWTLKELYAVYPVPTFRYLKRNVKKISPIAFSPATEKLNFREKQQLRRLRSGVVRVRLNRSRPIPG